MRALILIQYHIASSVVGYSQALVTFAQFIGGYVLAIFLSIVFGPRVKRNS